jgi:4-hydroxy-2-oxoheptanedioate aldolase
VIVTPHLGSWDDQSSLLAFRSVSLGSAAPMARVQENDYYAIGRLLDRGAMGIVVPMVNSAEDAKAGAFAVRYPPLGGRSIGAFATAYMGPDYLRWIDQEIFLAVQIESKTAADNAEEILSVDGVDGCWIGPADLAASMGVDLSMSAGAKAHEQTILQIRDACHKTGKIAGIAGGIDTAGYWMDQGFLFVTYANDKYLMLSKANEILEGRK